MELMPAEEGRQLGETDFAHVMGLLPATHAHQNTLSTPKITRRHYP